MGTHIPDAFFKAGKGFRVCGYKSPRFHSRSPPLCLSVSLSLYHLSVSLSPFPGLSSFCLSHRFCPSVSVSLPFLSFPSPSLSSCFSLPLLSLCSVPSSLSLCISPFISAALPYSPPTPPSPRRSLLSCPLSPSGHHGKVTVNGKEAEGKSNQPPG